MKQLAIAALVMIFGVGPVAAQSGGHIGLYSDPEGNCCVLIESLYVSNNVYVFHSMVPEAQAAQFMVENAWIGQLVGDVTYSGLVFGDIFTGVIVPYGGCQPTPHLVATMSFIPVYPTLPYTDALQVLPDPTAPSGQIEVMDCASSIRYATGGRLAVNYDYTPIGCEGCWTTSAEESTWSKLKALYR